MFELLAYERFRDTPSVRFFDVTVDDLNNAPLVTQLVFKSLSLNSGTLSYVSGVPGLPDGFQLKVHVDVQHLGRYFVRYDKFATLQLLSLIHI